MSLVVVGLNHHTCPVALRERLAFTADTIPAACVQLRKRLRDAGTVILSTCNRVEIYVHHTASNEDIDREIRAFLTEEHEVAAEELDEVLYTHSDADAAGHLFRVASSLDSLVVGEVQILGQVHDAYLLSQTEQAADKVIHALFQKAFSVAKAVRHQSDIGVGRVSISSVAVDLATSIFTGLSDKTVMVIGSGEMGELTLKSLVARGVGSVLIMNRSIEKAQALAGPYNGEALALGDFAAHLDRADIIITSTAAPAFILHPGDFWHALKQRKQAPMFVIDIAVPRDVDPEVGKLDNVYLYNVDDLEQVVQENLSMRRKEIAHCMTIVEKGREQFARWMHGLVAEPTFASMTEELKAIGQGELDKTLDSLPDLTDKQRQEVTFLTDRIVKRILQRSMTEIKQEIGHHDPGTVLHLVKRLFGIKD